MFYRVVFRLFDLAFDISVLRLQKDRLGMQTDHGGHETRKEINDNKVSHLFTVMF